MTRAKKRAFEKYPKLYSGSPYGPLPIELNIKERQLFIEGYEQAEKDTIERACKWLIDTGYANIIAFERFREAIEKEEAE